MKILFVYNDIPSLIIFYAIADHVLNYLKFLEKMFKRQDDKTNVIMYRSLGYTACIDVSENSNHGKYWKSILTNLEKWLIQQKVCLVH